MIAAGLLLLALVTGQEGFNNAPPPSGSQAQLQAGTPSSSPPPGDQTVICKTMPVTGSRFGTNECRTKAEWAAQAAAARDFIDNATKGRCSGASCK